MMSFECTRFPNLYHLEPKSVEQSSRTILNLDVANETLLIAWASLLGAYSGEDSEVLFRSNHGVVKVDLVTWHVEYVDDIHTTQPSRTAVTGLYFGRVRMILKTRKSLH
jgi:hypothetical protein